ncbi:MAG: HEPN domain-containing protein [Nitrospirae bacterium]|nr:HEPN domain-containing protein [Nitrospirota bacterium]
MTDKDVLFTYRLQEAEETLSEAVRMLETDFSPRSIVNRAYYAIFYALLALLLKTCSPMKTSKHIGVISTFDREFVKTGKIDKYFSTLIHDIFDLRQESDYKDLVQISREDAAQSVAQAREFLAMIKTHLGIIDNT